MSTPTNSFTIDRLVTEFGALYLNNGQNLSRLFRGLMQPGVTLNMPGLRHISTNESVWRCANPIIQSMLQAFQIGFTPKGNVDFHPNEIRLQHMKVDMQIVPHEIEESWLGFLNGDSDKIEKWPITKYIMQQVLDSVAEDKEINVAYNGVAATPTDGTAGDASEVMDGFHKKLCEGVLDSQYPIRLIDGMGALTTENIFEQLEYFVRHLPERYRRVPFHIFVSDDMRLAYLEAKRALGYYTITDDSQISTKLDFCNCFLHALPSMAGTNHIWATLPQNIVHLTKRDLSTAHFDVQKTDRVVKLLIDWWEAIGFICNDMVFTNRDTVSDSIVADPVLEKVSKNVFKMTSDTTGADIYYTTDGTEPTAETGTKFTSNLTIAADTTYTMKAFKTGLLPSGTVTAEKATYES